MDHSQLIEALSSHDLFSDLSHEDLLNVGRQVKVRQFFPDEVIVWQGQPSTALFLVVNGIVVVKRHWMERENVLAYLMPGSAFGEVGILENEPRSASILAVTEVEVLVIQRDDFLGLCRRHAVVALRLAQNLGRKLMLANRRMSQEASNGRLIVVVGVGGAMGATSFGTLLAELLASSRSDNTAYMEYPNSRKLLGDYEVGKHAGMIRHEGGFDILLPLSDESLPPGARATILLEKIQSSYANAVIKLEGRVDEVWEAFLNFANLVVLMAPADTAVTPEVESLLRRIKATLRQEDATVITLISHADNQTGTGLPVDFVDAEIPFLEDFPSFSPNRRKAPYIPEPLQNALDLCIQRLDRTHSIGIFIPTTSDANRQINTEQVRDQAMAFMAERFGGATWKPAQGVWLSEKLGLIGEDIYIVQSYTTRQTLHQYLDEIIIYIKTLKRELRQEAMALEVNKKLTLF
jgi:CRP-like cAMP-binding protein